MDERQKLIDEVLEKNKNENGFKGSLAYAEAYVDGLEGHDTSTAYIKGFCDGMRADQQYPQTLMVKGYNLEQLLKLIEKDQNNKEDNNGLHFQIIGRGKRMIKMTRRDAINNLYKIGHSPESANNTVKALEALGLLKFDEDNKTAHQIIKDMYVSYPGKIGSMAADGIIENLASHGYKIIKE